MPLFILPSNCSYIIADAMTYLYAALTVVSLTPEKKKTREATKSRIFLAKIKMLALFRGVEMDGL